MVVARAVSIRPAAWEPRHAAALLLSSVRSTAYERVSQLRDPTIFEENGAVYVLYAVGGESGIAIARLEFARG